MDVVTKVRSIQNTIFLTGRTGSTCSRERSATEDAFSVLNVIHYSLFVRWNRLSGHRELENVPEFEIDIEIQLFDDMLGIRKKWTKESAKECSWRENCSDHSAGSKESASALRPRFRQTRSMGDGKREKEGKEATKREQPGQTGAREEKGSWKAPREK